MKFTTLGILGYLRVIVTPTRYLMLMRFMPQVDICLHLEVALFQVLQAYHLNEVNYGSITRSIVYRHC